MQVQRESDTYGTRYTIWQTNWTFHVISDASIRIVSVLEISHLSAGMTTSMHC